MCSKLKCAIIDDEPLASDLLESYVQKTAFMSLTGKYSSAVSALEGLKSNPADLVFLDIQMPEVSGMDLAKIIGGQTMIIFTTAFEQFAVSGYKVNAVDYLLKPISYAEFLQASEKAQDRLSEHSGEKPESVFVKSDYKLIQVRFNEILYIEGLRDYLKIHTTRDSAPILTLMSMKSMSASLPEDRFVRVHKSYIVNMDKIEAVDRGRIVIGNTSIPIGDNYKAGFQSAIGVEIK